ncbi:maleylpyruvate isomerase family mycothiol-dependent enzyme [Nonomuraea candida]|uniref:maleylpyruvate isomerase family mycothiol-dependent enzyme n=1 Tax=Nonomuraea candida TaxID=359159 RepID=UPI0005BE5A8E|nr:maleylpyruvate isomerase family mycothiol-dependent enzyme [Nonomuraea candida]
MADSYLYDGQRPEDHLASCPGCGAAVALLDGPEPAAEPPPTLREAVLSLARRRRGPAVTGWSAVAVPYAEQVALMDELLAGLSAPQWEAPVARHGTVKDLVEHLTANDATVAGFMGVPSAGRDVPGPDAPGTDVPGAGVPGTDVPGAGVPGAGVPGAGPAGPEAGGGRIARVRRRWREQAGSLLERASAGGEVLLGVEVALAGARPARAPLRQAMIQRTFETWTHADDIRAATGRCRAAPPPEHVHMIAEFGLALLPRALKGPRRAVSATVVLTGPGGGAWTIPLSPASDHVAVLVSADAVGFCRLLAGRWPAGCFPYAAEGDPALARDLIAAAATLGCD